MFENRFGKSTFKRVLQASGSCFSNGKVYPDNHSISSSSEVKKLFSCASLKSTKNCSDKCKKDVCILNCPILDSANFSFDFEYLCYSNGKVYNNPCRAKCESKQIVKLFTCKNNRLDCSNKCKQTYKDELQKFKENDKNGNCVDKCENIWNPVCGDSGIMYENNCLLNCNGEKSLFYCSDKGLAFDDGKCRKVCKDILSNNLIKDDPVMTNMTANDISVESQGSEDFENLGNENGDRVSIGKNSFQTIEVNNDKITVLRKGEWFSIPNSVNIKGSNLKIKESNNNKSSSQIRSSSGFEKRFRKKKGNLKIKKNDENLKNESKSNIKENLNSNHSKKIKEKSKNTLKPKIKKPKQNKNNKKKVKKQNKKQNKNKAKLAKNNRSLDPNSFENNNVCLKKCKNKNKKKIVCFSNGKLYVDLCKPACQKLSSLFVCSKDISLKKCLLQCRQTAKQTLSN